MSDEPTNPPTEQPKGQPQPRRPWGDGVPTGSLALDLALGVGGWPRGRIVEVFGVAGSGKTTMLLHAVANAQKAGILTAYFDADHGLDRVAAERVGVDFGALQFQQGNHLEEVFEQVEKLVTGDVYVVALDSIASLLPASQRTCDSASGGRSESHQHLLDHCLKALLAPLAQSRGLLLVSNQIREKLGVFYGSPETMPWETQPLRDSSSLRVQLSRGSAVKHGDQHTGTEVKAKIVKSRIGAPLGTVTFELTYASGVCAEQELLELGMRCGLVARHGNRWVLGADDSTLGGSRAEAVRRLVEDQSLAVQLRQGIVQHLHT